MLWVNADLSSLEDKTKQCCIIDYDPEYVAELNVPGYDAHLAIGLRAGFFDEEDVKFYRYMKAVSDGKEPGELPTKYIGREEEFELLYGKMQDDRQKAKTVNYSCFLPNSQVLTPKGWKFIRNIQKGEEIISYNPDTGVYEQDFALDVVELEEEVYNFSNKRGTQFECTDSHRWLVNDKVGDEVYFTEAKDFSKYTRVLNSGGIWENSNADLPEGVAELLGWILSEGSINWSKKVGGTSSSGGKRERLE